MKAYLAGQSQCYKAISQVAGHMQQWGYEFTEPWWNGMETPTDPAVVAKSDVLGVLRAEVVFAVIDLSVGHGRGLWFELGYAFAQNIPIYVLLVGGEEHSPPFSEECDRLKQELVFLNLTTDYGRVHPRVTNPHEWATILSDMRVERRSNPFTYGLAGAAQRRIHQAGVTWCSDYLSRQAQWSGDTFGKPEEADRTEGCLRHIEAEIQEVRSEAKAGSKKLVCEETCDIIILALDILWRNGWVGEQVINQLEAKQRKNMARKWQKVDGDTPSMHIKEEES